MNFPVFIKASRTRVSVSKEIREVSRLRLQFERSMQSRLMGVFKKVGKAAADEYQRSGSVSASLRPLDKDLELVFRGHYAAVVDKFGQRVYENRKLERFGQLIVQLYEREGAKKVVGISNTTRNIINRAILEGEKEALGVRPIAKLIEEKTFGAIGRARASTIARTETHAAASYATHQSTKELGLPAQRKQWVSVSDGRARPHHAAANGQEVGIDEPFIIRYKGQEVSMMYPHDGAGGGANNINCRCLAIYFADEDAIFDGLGDEDISVDDAFVASDLKPEIDLIDKMTVTGFSKADLNAALNDWLTPLTARVASKLIKPRTVVGKPKYGTYYSGLRKIESGLERQVMAHEYGHHVDRSLYEFGGKFSTYWSETGLASAWAADKKISGVFGLSAAARAKKFKELKSELYDTSAKEIKRADGSTYTYASFGALAFDGADAIMDIIDSFTNGKFHASGAYGHGYTYWKTRKGHGPQSEAFANLFALQKSPEAVKYVKKNMPNLWKAFTDKLEEFDANN
tara:strand:- start:770 stop:2317 length:1548 start_codon:yes stop_codon:yes gene_type:complete